MIYIGCCRRFVIVYVTSSSPTLSSRTFSASTVASKSMLTSNEAFMQSSNLSCQLGNILNSQKTIYILDNLDNGIGQNCKPCPSEMSKVWPVGVLCLSRGKEFSAQFFMILLNCYFQFKVA